MVLIFTLLAVKMNAESMPRKEVNYLKPAKDIIKDYTTPSTSAPTSPPEPEPEKEDL